MTVTRRRFLGVALSAGGAFVGPAGAPVAQIAGTVPRRIVTIVPAVTEILFAIGAGEQVVGVSSFARYPPAVEHLPRVGALLDPDIERILSLEPDLVVLYGSQTDAMTQMARAGIRVWPYRHGGLDDITRLIRRLGVETGHAAAADGIAADIETRLRRVRRRVEGRPRPRVLLVLGREPDTVRQLYASGGLGFLHDMLVAAGGQNVFGAIRREATQPTSEGLLTAAPDVILEVRAEGLLPPDDTTRRVWSGLPSIPAVRHGRIYALSGNDLVVPGTRVADATERIARVLHPDAF